MEQLCLLCPPGWWLGFVLMVGVLLLAGEAKCLSRTKPPEHQLRVPEIHCWQDLNSHFDLC